MARSAAQQAEAQRASDDALEKRAPRAAEQALQRLDQRLLIDERVAKAVRRDGLAGLGQGKMLLREDAFGAKDDFEIRETIGEAEEEVDAAREGDRPEVGEAGEKLLP